jgi:GNAT superfamily N-acetyltransferase
MYAHLAAAWVAEGYFTHLVSLLANDQEGHQAWHWLGFGMIAADGVRDLEPAQGPETDMEIRRAGSQDVEQVMALNEALARYLAASPTFLADTEQRDRAYYQAWLQDPEKAIWLADDGCKAVAYLGLGPASEDASTIIRDEKTASIFGAFAEEQARGQGLATALLNRSLAWAHAAGYSRCAVDFEPMNPLASRFWLRHFEPVCYTLVRSVDEIAGGVEAA